MASQYVFTNILTTTNFDHAIDLIAQFDTAYVAPNVSAFADGFQATGIFGSQGDHHVNIQGHVGSGQYFGIVLDGTNNAVTIGTNGSVSSLAQTAASAIFFSSASNRVVNNGLVKAEAVGIDMSSNGNVVHNFGTISSRLTAIDLGGGDILNRGTISSTSDVAIRITDTFLVNSVRNYGLIAGEDFAGAISGAGGEESIFNYGEISGYLDLGDGSNTYFGGAQSTLDGGIFTGTGFDQIINRGTITGEVSLGANNDFYDGAGGTAFFINLGDGNDVAIGGDGSELLSGGLGTDEIDCGGGNDILFFGGGESSDGNDTYEGGAGIDTLDASESGTVAVTIDLDAGYA
ncbi:MAG: calcium-binding protein, partial [Hyphomicrobium sp.]